MKLSDIYISVTHLYYPITENTTFTAQMPRLLG